MPIRKELIADFANDFYSARTFDEAFDIYFQLILKSGFDAVLYSYIPHIYTANKFSVPPIFKSSVTYPEDFLEFYAENRLDKNDFVIKAILNGETNILDWWEVAVTQKLTEDEFSQLKLVREKYGMTNGITIPTMSDQRGIAGASIISSKDGDEYKTLKAQNLKTISLCTRMFHDFTLSRPLSSNTFVMPLFPDLTEKEIQVLRFQLTGKPMKQIKESTGITPKYAEKLLLNIRKKFGNISTKELIHQTSVFNIIDGTH